MKQKTFFAAAFRRVQTPDEMTPEEQTRFDETMQAMDAIIAEAPFLQAYDLCSACNRLQGILDSWPRNREVAAKAEAVQRAIDLGLDPPRMQRNRGRGIPHKELL